MKKFTKHIKNIKPYFNKKVASIIQVSLFFIILVKNYNMNNDKHWVSLPYPLKPCKEEIDIFDNNILKGKVLLLGCTFSLLKLCDEAIDLVPKYDDPKIKQGDWNNIDGFYDTIIGDGVLSWGAEEVLNTVSKHCKVFICRVFSEKLEGMKYATHFYKDFDNAEKLAEINKSCPIFIWRFTER